MKRFLFGAFALVASLSGCQHDEVEPRPAPEVLYPVQFTLQWNTEVLPFSKVSTRAYPGPPPYSSPEAVGTGSDKQPDSDGQQELSFSHIEYIVFRKEAGGTRQFLKEMTYTRETSDGDFGIIYDKLPAGSFEIVFLTHSDPAAVRSGEHFSFSTITDTFWKSATYEVSSTAATNETPTLSRIIGRIEFVSTDVVPAEQSEFSIYVQPHLFEVDLFGGQAADSEDTHDYRKATGSDAIGHTGTHAIYTFIPASGAPLSIRLRSLDADGAVLRERNIEEVHPLANRTLRYTGILYNPPKDGDSFDLQFDQDGAWGETSEEQLPDEVPAVDGNDSEADAG